MTDPTGYFPVPTQIQGQGLMPPNMQTQPFNPLMSTGYAPGQYTQAAQGLASGLLGPMNQNTQQAYQLAGSPSMGPFASLTPPPLKPGSTGGSITNNTTGGGALGLGGLLSDASTASKLYNAVSGLLGPSLSQYASGSVGNAALQGAVNANGGIPALTNDQLGLTQGGGVPNGDSGGAAAGGNAADAAAAVGTGGLLGAAGGAGAGTGAITITDEAGNVLVGAGADGAGAAGAAGTDAGAGAASGSSSGAGVGAGGAALGAYLGYELYDGLTSGSVNPLLGTNLGPESQAWTNDWLNNSGPGLQFISGTGSADSPLTVNLKNGTQISGDQYQKLQDMMKGFVLDNKSNGMFTDQKPLTDAQSKQLSDYLTSVSTQQPAANAGYGQPNTSSTPASPYGGLTQAQFQQMQNYYANMGGR